MKTLVRAKLGWNYFVLDALGALLEALVITLFNATSPTCGNRLRCLLHVAFREEQLFFHYEIENEIKANKGR